MASQQDLVKIGLEGFDIIDRFYGAPNKRSTNGSRQRQGRWGFQGIQSHHTKEEQVINSKDAASQYGGIMILNYPNTKPHNRWGKIFKVFKSSN
ncbi:hypothetical protein VNO77_23656 [Canavalia gladiata]|uniref:Uncharacterized protein n=1 Tax=Canavalia gladiata TaxID=3824 RepID=A0AAN9L4T8_CANGL